MGSVPSRSEYTPTTDEVRDDYQWGRHACGCCAERLPEDLEAFDRWLAEHDRQVAERAWGEGFNAGQAWEADVNSRTIPQVTRWGNPYRKEQS